MTSGTVESFFGEVSNRPVLGLLGARVRVLVLQRALIDDHIDVLRRSSLACRQHAHGRRARVTGSTQHWARVRRNCERRSYFYPPDGAGSGCQPTLNFTQVRPTLRLITKFEIAALEEHIDPSHWNAWGKCCADAVQN